MDTNYNGIAIIGMSGRFPGAGNLDEFWRNLVAGVESISFFSDEELAAAGLDLAELKKDPTYVAARGIVKDAEWFDAGFFSVSAREAEGIDPQQRIFLEASWEVLENAGYDPARAKGYIGVFAGMSPNTYYLNSLYSRPDLVKHIGNMAVGFGEKDFLATRVAYKLNLRGPALSINTACSTSLVAVCQACQALLGYQCDIALAGGVSVTFPQKRPYYPDGGMFSPDGHCRPFDAQAAGTNFSDALGVVALKRLSEAVNDGDQIYAVIKGFGLNNDGSAKVGFAAPSVDGQAEVIALAQAQAGIEPASISYIETHGTATPLGDPIEIAGLTKAFRAGTSRKHFCAIGSVKGNIGHTDAAAGIASLIKTALALKHKMLPPSLHFTAPNPKINFSDTPFFVNSSLAEWKAGPTQRRAGVSGFGVGGTNAHIVLEEAPPLEPSGPSREWKILLLSARTSSALESATANFHDHLKTNPDLNLADAAFTLQLGRRVFENRRMLVCRNIGEATQMLEACDPKRLLTQQGKVRERPVVFMFPGQGAQNVNMGAETYRTEAVFKKEVDRCAQILKPHLDLDLRKVLFPLAEQVKAAEELLVQTRITQPALFVIEYALARLWMSWGVKPAAMIGHSVGEYVAGCLAGVFTLEEALTVVAGRARLVQAQPGGAMLAVRLAEKEALALLPSDLSIAAANSASLCVVSGPFDAVEKFEAQLKLQEVAARRLQTSHAFHSAMMDPVLQPLAAMLTKVHFNKPSIPYVSNVTGRWITDSEAMDPKYWASHVRQTVRFADGVGELLKDPENILLEVGPGQTLSSLASQHPAKATGHVVVSSYPPSREQELPGLLGALGKLWLAGAPVDWSGFYRNEKRRRVSLPTYPFERKRYWIEPAATAVAQQAATGIGIDSVLGSVETTNLSPARDTSSHAADTKRCAGSRKDSILALLTTQFQEMSSANLADVGPSASFMEMGLDSLFLVQVSSTIEKQFGIKITFRQLLEDLSSLIDLASYLDQKLPSEAFGAVSAAPETRPANSAPVPTPALPISALDAMEAQLRALTHEVEMLRRAAALQPPTVPQAAPAPGIPTDYPDSTREPSLGPAEPLRENGATGNGAERTGIVTLPLTGPQMELWLAAQAGEEASCAFNQVFAIHLRDRVHAEEMGEIVQQLVNRHDALRTTFAEDGSTQRIHPSWKITLLSRDLSELSEAEQEREIAETLARENQTAFNLANGPLFRLMLLELSEDRSVLILAAHHIILDGWSMGVLLREFSRLYNALEHRTTAELEPAMQYRDYVERQNSAEYRAAVAVDEAYWFGQFAKLPEDIELPADRQRPPVKTYRVAQKHLLLEPSLYELLKQTAAAHGCTLFVFLLAGLKAWMFRLTGQEDLVIGIPAAGQPAAASHPGNKLLVGHCVSTLPLRSHCEASVHFSDHLRAIKSLLLDAYEHQHITLGTLVRNLQLRTDPSRAPLIPLIFNFGRVSRELKVPGARVSIPPRAFDFFDLHIAASDTGRDIDVVCHYNTDLFDASRVEQMLSQFRTLLTAAAEDPGLKVMELPLLTDKERRKLLVEWNHTEEDYPKNRCLHELIEEEVEHAPEALAVVFENQQLTYRELNTRANQLARHLQTLGIGPDSLVGICVERSLEMVVGLLGILKAGGAYVPLDPSYPKERLAVMLEDAQVGAILTQRRFHEAISRKGIHVVDLDADWPEIARESAENPRSGAAPHHLAYVIYTSGSTGQPKGVAMEHQALVNLISWQCKDPSFARGLKTLQFASLNFDVSFQEIFSTWCSGGTLLLISEELRKDFGSLLRFLNEQRIERLLLPFVALEHLAEMAANQNLFPPDLRQIITAGEQLQITPHLRTLFEKTKGCTLQNQYGPTEAHVVTAFTLSGPPSLWPKLPPIGRPISNTAIYVLDKAMQPVPIGVPGELYIGGTCLARGYLNRPELTDQKFVSVPIGKGRPIRLYKTGDIARFLQDGNIEFLGRSDFQIKIRGFRVETGEIEAILALHPAVQQAVVVAREDQSTDKRLVAYIARRNGEASPAELKSFLRGKLPEYMVPSAFVTLDQFPLTPNGKVDRKALPKPEFESAASEFVPPSSPTEIALAKIWCEVLGLKRVSLRDNFFELGGHSLLATKLLLKLNNAFAIGLTLRMLFERPKLADLAKQIDLLGWARVGIKGATRGSQEILMEGTI